MPIKLGWLYKNKFIVTVFYVYFIKYTKYILKILKFLF
jgi:hypothetical protein